MDAREGTCGKGRTQPPRSVLMQSAATTEVGICLLNVAYKISDLTIKHSMVQEMCGWENTSVDFEGKERLLTKYLQQGGTS